MIESLIPRVHKICAVIIKQLVGKFCLESLHELPDRSRTAKWHKRFPLSRFKTIIIINPWQFCLVLLQEPHRPVVRPFKCQFFSWLFTPCFSSLMESQIDTRWIANGLSEASVEKARLELNETPEKRAECLAALREKIREHLVENEGSLSSIKDTDKFLVTFLRARKYDVERAFTLLVNYDYFRGKHANLVEGTTFEMVRPILEKGIIRIFGDRDSQGRRMIMFRPAQLFENNKRHEDGIRTLIFVLDRLIEDEETQVNGFVFINNFEGMSAAKVIMSDKSHVSVVMAIFQDAFPARFKAFHVVNNSTIFRIVYALMKPFMREKMRQRYHMHGSDRESLFAVLPKVDVPSDIDGERSPYDPHDVVGFLSCLENREC